MDVERVIRSTVASIAGALLLLIAALQTNAPQSQRATIALVGLVLMGAMTIADARRR